jgi:competence protein ComEC
LRTPLRWSGALVLLCAIAWALTVSKPDILISTDGRNVAVRGRDGRLHLMQTGKDAFLVKEWLAADADARAGRDPSLGEGVSCDEAGCVVAMADGDLVARALRADALADDCARAALVVTARQPPRDCGAATIDQARLYWQGAGDLKSTPCGREATSGRGRRWLQATARPIRRSSVRPRRARWMRRPRRPTCRRTIEQGREVSRASRYAVEGCCGSSNAPR